MTKTLENAITAMKSDMAKKRISLEKIISQKDFLALFKKHAKQAMLDAGKDGDYIINDVVKTVLGYFYGLKDFNKYGVVLNTASLDKGLYIYGPYGVGKSMLMDIISRMALEIRPMWFATRTAPWFVDEFMIAAKDKTGQSTFSIKQYYKGKLNIDDLGMEDLAFNSKNVMADVLFYRHRNRAITYVSSNDNPSQAGEKYGARIGDRIPEMFNIIKWEGNSLREE